MANGLSWWRGGGGSGTNYLAIVGGDRLQPDTAQGYFGFNVAGGTVTTSRPVYEATQTWNDGAVTFTAVKVDVTDTASAAGSLLMDFQVATVSKFSVGKAGDVLVASAGSYAIGGDVFLYRDAAAVLAQRNSTNAQTFRLYNTFTDSSNYERMGITWSGNACLFMPTKGGTGTERRADYYTNGPAGSETGMFGIGFGGGNFAGFIVGGTTSATLFSTGLQVASNGMYRFAQSNAFDTTDLAIGRNAAGVAEITNGVANTYRDLILRHLTFSAGVCKTAEGASLIAASTLTPLGDGNHYSVSGATTINLIDIVTSKVQAGTFITLVFTEAVTVKHNQGASGDGKPIMLAGAADFSATADDTLMLVYNGGNAKWYEVSRTVI